MLFASRPFLSLSDRESIDRIILCMEYVHGRARQSPRHVVRRFCWVNSFHCSLHPNDQSQNMPPLPRELPPNRIGSPDTVSAYNRCLLREASLDNGADVAKKLIYVRILGYLLHHVPSQEGLRIVVKEIKSCRTDEALLELGIMYFNHFIRAFRANKGRTPTPSNHLSRRSFDTMADMINDTLDDAPQSHTTAKNKALYRDGYRCMVTGKYDASWLEKITEVQNRFDSDPTNDTTCTECAHIFSESTNADIEPGLEKRGYAATMWAIMKRFGYKTLPEDLNGSKVHRLENVMTLDVVLHRYFDGLRVWFIKVENQDNTYKLEAVDTRLIRHLPNVVTFTTPDPVNFPLPSPTYLAIHAACAKVAHLSGAAEYIDKFYRDMEDRAVLSTDGSSADVLEHALFELCVAGYGITT